MLRLFCIGVAFAVTLGACASEPEPRPFGIPGLGSPDLTINLENRGLTCSGPRQEQTMASWRCELADSTEVRYQVEYLGAPSSIEYVNATVSQLGSVSDDSLAASFFGYVATIPYDGALPSDARAWVEANVGGMTEAADMTERQFGPAMFRLRGPERARTLSIATPDSGWMQ